MRRHFVDDPSYSIEGWFDEDQVTASYPIRGWFDDDFVVPVAAAASGSAAITEGADTVAASGSPSVSGSAAITEGADTVTAAGTPSVTGAAAITEGTDTAAGVGSPSVTGTAAITEGADTVTAVGAPSVTGSAAITEDADTVAADGTAVSGVTGIAAITEDADTVAAAGDIIPAPVVAPPVAGGTGALDEDEEARRRKLREIREWRRRRDAALAEAQRLEEEAERLSAAAEQAADEEIAYRVEVQALLLAPPAPAVRERVERVLAAAVVERESLKTKLLFKRRAQVAKIKTARDLERKIEAYDIEAAEALLTLLGARLKRKAPVPDEEAATTLMFYLMRTG